MLTRAVQDLPVPILTDEELLAEYDRTFCWACTDDQPNGAGTITVDPLVRRNAATMGELLRRGFRSQPPRWVRAEA